MYYKYIMWLHWLHFKDSKKPLLWQRNLVTMCVYIQLDWRRTTVLWVILWVRLLFSVHWTFSGLCSSQCSLSTQMFVPYSIPLFAFKAWFRGLAWDVWQVCRKWNIWHSLGCQQDVQTLLWQDIYTYRLSCS